MTPYLSTSQKLVHDLVAKSGCPETNQKDRTAYYLELYRNVDILRQKEESHEEIVVHLAELGRMLREDSFNRIETALLRIAHAITRLRASRLEIDKLERQRSELEIVGDHVAVDVMEYEHLRGVWGEKIELEMRCMGRDREIIGEAMAEIERNKDGV